MPTSAHIRAKRPKLPNLLILSGRTEPDAYYDCGMLYREHNHRHLFSCCMDDDDPGYFMPWDNCCSKCYITTRIHIYIRSRTKIPVVCQYCQWIDYI